jgi:hypothetical protein
MDAEIEKIDGKSSWVEVNADISYNDGEEVA